MVDNSMTVLTIIGTVASLYGAWVAWKQAGISKSAAALAGTIKEQLIGHRVTSELAELQVYLESTRRTFVKYGARNPQSLTGVNHGNDAEVALEFTHKLKLFRDYFSDSESNAADNVVDEIDANIKIFKSASKLQDISDMGYSILNIVVGFSPILRKKFTEQKERTID